MWPGPIPQDPSGCGKSIPMVICSRPILSRFSISSLENTDDPRWHWRRKYSDGGRVRNSFTDACVNAPSYV